MSYIVLRNLHSSMAVFVPCGHQLQVTHWERLTIVQSYLWADVFINIRVIGIKSLVYMILLKGPRRWNKLHAAFLGGRKTGALREILDAG